MQCGPIRYRANVKKQQFIPFTRLFFSLQRIPVT